MAVAAARAWARTGLLVGGQVRGQRRSAPGAGGVVGDGGGGGQGLGQESAAGRGQVRGQGGQRLGAGVVVGDGGGSGQRLGQQVGGQVRRQRGQRLGAGVVVGDGGGGGQGLGQQVGRQAGGPAAVSAPAREESSVMAVAAARAWARTGLLAAGRCGASAASAWRGSSRR